MKGYTFEIKNNLLEPKHIEAMGTAIWLFMWLDDKITKIDENEVGWVLGGKPIKYEQVKEELGITQITYSRWIKRLVKYPYIKAIRTPYGISFRVYKAHKSFGKRFNKNDKSNISKMINLPDKNDKSNKTTTVDNYSKTKEQELPIWINKKAWEAWEQHRKEIKKKLTPTTMRLQLKFLEKYKEDHVEIIRNSITNGWTGLFPIKKGFQGNSDAARVLRKQQDEKEAERERENAGKDNEAFRKLTGDIKNLAKSKSI